MLDELFPLFLSMRQRCSYVTGFNVSAYRYNGSLWTREMPHPCSFSDG